jgi:Domain of unknown function (DUF222)/HNH endonuclease
MSGLRSALEEWSGQDLTDVDVDDLADDLVELELASGLLEAERGRRLTRFDEISGPRREGFPSLTAFLIHRCRMAAGRARRLVGLANTATRSPHVHEAWSSLRISTDQAHRLLEAADVEPVAFAEAEERLVGIVEPLTASETRRALAYWSQSVTGGEGTVLEQEAQRGISLSRTIGGMGRIDGWLTPTAFETLHTTLDALMPPPSSDDHRTARQRRHDALEDLAREFLDHVDTPVVGGERPHINVICDPPALQSLAGGLHEFESGEVITIDTLRQMACDSSVSRVVFGPESEVIDVGRRTRIIPAALKRAIIARDGHCTWQGGCDRGPRWCDIHHLHHWADGGETKPDNLTLLCRYHHTLTHKGEGRSPPGGS